MAYRILSNKKNKSVSVLFTSSSILTVPGAEGVSDLAIDGEILTGVTIKRALHGSISGGGSYWTVARGANTVAIYDGSGLTDYAGNGFSMDLDSGANLVVTLTGTTGTLILELGKLGTNLSPY